MCISGLIVNGRGKHIVEGGAHGGCRSTLWMGMLFGTDTWQLFTGNIVLKEGQSMRVVKVTHSLPISRTLHGKFALSHREETTIKIIFMTLLKLLKS